jgi:hypothetical protein
VELATAFPSWAYMRTYTLPLGVLIGLSGIAFFVGLVLH